MNIKELAEQAGLSEWRYEYAENEFEHFAELIRLDETKACADHYLGIMRDAVEQAVMKEREECAKFFDENDRQIFWGSTVVRLIRQRGDK